MIKILVSDNCPCFNSVAHNFRYIFQRNGINSEIYSELNDDTESTDLWICVWNDIPKLPKNCIVVNMDPMNSIIYPKFEKLIANSPPIKHLINYSFADSDKFSSFSFSVIPYGFSTFHNWLYNLRQNKTDRKDIDILFYGSYNKKRSERLHEINSFAKTHGYVFVYRSMVFNETEKAELVSRSKIVLSLPTSDVISCKTNDLARLSYLISNKAFVLAERIGDSQVEDKLKIPFLENGQTFESEIVKYLANEKLRTEISEKAYTNFKNDFPFEEMFLSTVKKFT